ncbi:hypothetical protein M9Y10_005217 [Tritrichomonas musculus]|uniref:Myb-like DNA-binding domain containing protein n=1 Tax=Tritrichomonas musculus TaxID=1915356 RepID=A0ABR2JL71_9EUKA
MNQSNSSSPSSSPLQPLHQQIKQQNPLTTIIAASNATTVTPKNQINQVTGKKKQIRHKFTSEEDEKITRLVEEHGRDWRLVANEIPGLNSRQCRERYVFYLDPNIANQEWSEDDMQKLIELVQEYGKTWTKITQFFPNRSVINVKNQWQKMMRHKHLHMNENSNFNNTNINNRNINTNFDGTSCTNQFMMNNKPNFGTISATPSINITENIINQTIEEEDAPFFLTFDDFTADLDLVLSKTPGIEEWFF